MMSARRDTSASEETFDIFGATLTRRRFVKGGGAMVVGVSLAGAGLGAKVASAADTVQLSPATNSLDATLPSSWFDINADNTITMRLGPTELGQGSASTALGMLAAEELNVPYSAITQVVMGDSDRTPGGGAAYGYMANGAPNIKKVAAYTFQALLSLASTHLGVPVASLTVTDGVVSGGGQSVSYGQLVANSQLNLTIPITGSLTGVFSGQSVGGTPPTKPVSDYTIIGQSIPMRTIPGIVTGEATYVGDVRLPGMLHGRTVHPPTLGANLVAVGKLDKSQFPNTQIVVKGNFVGVVDPVEYTAIEAASLLEGTTKWTDWSGLPGSDNLYGALREANWGPPGVGSQNGNASAALAGAAKTVSASYEFPYAKHAPIGPTAAVADVRSDGTVWVYAHLSAVQCCRSLIAMMLNISPNNVIVRQFEGSGHYGRSNGGSTGAEEEAVILSQAVGKPVRLQWMRWDDMRWSTNHEPNISDFSGGLDANGNLVALTARHYMAALQDDRMVGALLAGLPTITAPGAANPTPGWIGSVTNGLSDTWVYDQIPNQIQEGFGGYQLGTDPTQADFNQQIGMRGHSMRTPGQRQQNFGREVFMNELAAAANMDPIQFRIKNTSATRLVKTRPSPSPTAAATGSTALSGQGCSVMLRAGSYYACVAQVSVVPKTGKVTVTNVTSGIDPGIVVNPRQLQRMMEGGATMGTSEALHEEVHFNTGGITDHDWVSFPILRMIELPKIKTIIINNPSVGTIGGGGEGPNGFVQSAIASAVFDATGKQPRRLPLIPGYIRALLAS
jgi:nicotinate dehydrogenase subunit B